MNLSWLNDIIDVHLENLRNAPEEMRKSSVVSLEEYKGIADRNAFAIYQIEQLKSTIKEFIKNANEIK